MTLCTTENEGEIIFVHMPPQIDHIAARSLELELRSSVIEEPGALLCDFSETRYISSSGLRVILAIAKMMKSSGGRFGIYSLSPFIAHIFSMSGFSQVISIYESRLRQSGLCQPDSTQSGGARHNLEQEGIIIPRVNGNMSGMDIPAMLDKAHNLTKVGRYDDAISQYDKILEIDGNNTVVLENKGKVYYYLGRHEDAIACYDKAIAINPKLVTVWYKKATPCGRSAGMKRRYSVLTMPSRLIRSIPLLSPTRDIP